MAIGISVNCPEAVAPGAGAGAGGAAGGAGAGG